MSIFKISDQLPTFCTAKNTDCFFDAETKLIKNMRIFNIKTFLIDQHDKLSGLSLESSSETNADASNLVDMFNSIFDNHAPLRLMSRQKKQLNYKPWITRGILTSIKTKNELSKNI